MPSQRPANCRTWSGWSWCGSRSRRSTSELGPSGRNLVGPSMSPVTFAPEIPRAAAIRGPWPAARHRRQARRKRGRLERAATCDDDPETGTRAVADQPAGGRVRRPGLRRICQQRAGGHRAGAGGAAVARGGVWPSCCHADDGSDRRRYGLSLERGRPNRHRRRNGSAHRCGEDFSASTQELLAKARLKVTAAESTCQRADRSPTAKPRSSTSRSFDCVVVLGAVSDADVQAIATPGVRSSMGERSQVARPDSDCRGRAAHSADVDAVYTGVVPIVYKAQRALLRQSDPEHVLVVRHDHAADDVGVPQRLRRRGGDAAQRAAGAGGVRRHGVAGHSGRHRLDDGGEHRAGRRGGRHDPLSRPGIATI